MSRCVPRKHPTTSWLEASRLWHLVIGGDFGIIVESFVRKFEALIHPPLASRLSPQFNSLGGSMLHIRRDYSVLQKGSFFFSNQR